MQLPCSIIRHRLSCHIMCMARVHKGQSEDLKAACDDCSTQAYEYFIANM